MRDERVSLHLSESDATCSFSSLSVDGNKKKVGNFVYPGQRKFFLFSFAIEVQTLTGCRVNGSIGPVVLT